MDPTTSGGGGGENQAAAAPVPVSSANAPPPFLSKTYDMVDDAETNAIVSWSAANNSFIVWNPPEFARDLLPKYFKHNNFSSFVRQLNTYGFRKVDPDRWEFANEGFLRGQKHLLRNINRRKPVHVQANQQSQPSHGQSSSVGACVEVGKFGLEEEVEILKRDKNVLMQELVRLRQQQQTTDNQLQTTVQRLQGMEQRQQQMMSFLAKAVQSPGFLAQFVQQQQQNESNRRINEANKKRRIRQEEGIPQSEFSAATDGQIVKYQPMMNDAAMAMLRQIMNFDTSSTANSFDNTLGNFLIGDGSSPSTAIDTRGSSSRPSGVRLQEVFPTSGSVPETAVISGSGPSATVSELQSPAQLATTVPFPREMPSIPTTTQEDIAMPEISQIPEMVPEGMPNNILENNFALPEGDSLGIDFSNPFNMVEDFNLDNDLDQLLVNDSFWDDLLMQSPAPGESSSPDGASNDEARPIENGSNNNQNMEQLTEQMGLLTSHNKKV